MEARKIDVAWPVAEAKARFSELLDRVATEGPQVISKHGKDVAVVVGVDQWRRRSERTESLVEFFASSPLRDSGIEIDRVSVEPRDVELS